MEITLTSEQKRLLELEHRYESDARICDRIKAVLLKSENWTDKAIAQALRIHEETVRRHLSDWINKKKIRPENGGSESKLNHVQTDALERHLEGNVYSKVIEICAYVENTFQVHYTISGMTKWLKQHNFRYKKPKGIPAKADKAFVEAYLQLVEEISSNEPVIFIDATHPTMATKISYGWIKKGVDKPIAQTAAKTRVNVMGGIELASMKVVTKYPEFVNTESTIQFLRELKMAYPEAPKLHIILDQSSYHRSQAVQDFSKLEANAMCNFFD